MVAKKNKITMALDFIRNNFGFVPNPKYTIFKELGRCLNGRCYDCKGSGDAVGDH